MQKLNNIKLIGISGNASSGKDSLYLILEEILNNKQIKIEKISLADKLKIDLFEFIKLKTGISVFTNDRKQKEIIRPIMVSYGKAKRILSNGQYWISLINNKVKECISNKIIPIITDVRYDEYPKDEFSYILENNGILIYVERIDANGNIIPPANIEEETNNIKLKSQAHYILKWPTTDNLEIRKDCVLLQLKDLLNKF